MKERAQKTLHQPVELSGVGLHTGVEAAVRLLPGDPDTGIVFRRTDLPGHPEVPARLDYRCERRRCTALQNGKAEVQTVEHLLAALHAFELDNVVVEISGPEVPGLDGSSLPFVEALRSGRVTGPGRCESSRPRERRAPRGHGDGPVDAKGARPPPRHAVANRGSRAP